MAFLTSARLLPVIVLGLAILAGSELLVAQEALESDVKAAFLFNFTKFVDWPAGAFERADDPMRVCVVAEASFVASVDRILAGETVRGRSLRRVVPQASDLPHCHVLYVGETKRADTLLSPIAQAPVLTVGESARFLDQGGAIAFILANDRVRFDVNLKAADRAGLTISSKLLRVARDIRERGKR